MSEKKIIDWFTSNGKHIPIYEGESKQDALNRSIAKDNEEKKQSDIEKNAKEADRLNKKKDKSNSLEDKYKYINPRFKKDASTYDSEGFNNNCVKCAIAFEANMRGDDVQANPFKFGDLDDLSKSRHPEKAFNTKDVWNAGESKRELAIKRVNDYMEDWGNGSRAILQSSGDAKHNSRHALNIINDNGSLIVIDAQNGTQGTLAKMLKGLGTKDLIIIRTDDKDISEEYKKWAYRKRDK